MKRGDIYWATLSPRSGSEQSGRRPVIILSHDAFNQTSAWRSIIVVPLSTSTTQARRGPTVVTLSAGTGGLPGASSALCHQITTLDRAKLTEKTGSLSTENMVMIEQALLAAVDIRR
ncbi:MAG: type II toxin-antitoxin system PemK/MazF family toxin [Geobacteraceae bacterium]|nr:type II toxin-antitoxin system PemK/MazF family toxin [Geobacteraceae bacterium]